MFEIKYSKEDDRFKDNPLVAAAPEVIFYAGQPIVSSEGYRIGTLCVIDNKPSELSPEQKKSLKILSQHVRVLLDLRKKNIELQKAVVKLESGTTEMMESLELQRVARREPSFT